ncbi:MAG: molybdopterin-synthase adenylyltransferase MoeB [Gammaproteobacteria bacterium]|nr:molybdopterin-synthase adenylyltransferase MoeB [Gammaproteobacteria bacterium]MBU1624751.1 molybdopterin-synthase adenylyltransferase MoeB [Gammaproteobacteria bacterium]MBU1982595.1 molybdopterin-synthase adenylyltransferase MoeB [Gammaproteobacteria bacterium]
MDDSQLLRYSRHILLPEIGIEGQQSFLDAHVLILGAGGLGSPAAMFLAASGVGTLTLCDDDQVDLTNLQRQLAHRTTSIGVAKVESAQQTLNAINPGVRVRTVQERADEARLTAMVAEADVVLDCSDNFPTRYALNRVCSTAGKPLVSGAATRFDGQVSVFDFRKPDSPCYNCLYPEDSESEETRCAVMGVFAPLVGIVGSMQAAEALKLLAGIDSTLHGRLLALDALTMQPRVMKLARDPQCAVCSG